MMDIFFIVVYCMFLADSNSFGMQASSSGDNAGFIGNAAGVQEDEGDGDSSGSEADGSSSEGESSWGSEGNSSSEVYEELYKDWEELFGKENPVFKGMKIVMESTRRTTKLMKKAIVLGMYLVP